MISAPDRLPQKNAILALADGRFFRGFSIGAGKPAVGEVIFNTAMTGYQEILTDPSYFGQIIVFTAPHIGNTGINPEDIESTRIYCAGAVLHQLPALPSNWRMNTGLPDYLQSQNLPALSGVDTRALTRVLRSEGAQAGALVAMGYNGINSEQGLIDFAVNEARQFGSMSGKALAYDVSSKTPCDWTEGEWQLTGYRPASTTPKYRVAVLDFGVKRNILRRLVRYGCAVRVFPARTHLQTLIDYQPHGILLSNGPGDPEPCLEVIETIRGLLARRLPIFGICLGHQLLGLALGGKCQKMKFGHHGANHPVLDIESRRVMITSQNHGFAIDEASLPTAVKVTHRSLFDGSLQGFAHHEQVAFGFQGHPEASPGPQDIDGLFKKFIGSL